MPLDDRIAKVTKTIEDRSRDSRALYLERMRRAAEDGPRRAHLSCGVRAARICLVATRPMPMPQWRGINPLWSRRARPISGL